LGKIHPMPIMAIGGIRTGAGSTKSIFVSVSNINRLYKNLYGALRRFVTWKKRVRFPEGSKKKHSLYKYHGYPIIING
jgi:hypothetical protein